MSFHAYVDLVLLTLSATWGGSSTTTDPGKTRVQLGGGRCFQCRCGGCCWNGVGVKR